MGDREAERCRRLVGDTSDVIGVGVPPDGLPLAHARNAGARHALAAGAELLVFLDVDCIPGAALLQRYEAAAAGGPALLCGPVAYLPPAPRAGYRAADLHTLASPHPARPIPPEDEVQRGGDHALFWTLSFAVTAATWRLLGGFCEDYVGYGGEDTDFGQVAARAGVELAWVGGAWAYHQHHATETPPVQPPHRHPPQRRTLSPALGLVADARLAHGVRRTRPGAPRPGRRPLGPGHDGIGASARRVAVGG